MFSQGNTVLYEVLLWDQFFVLLLRPIIGTYRFLYVALKTTNAKMVGADCRIISSCKKKKKSSAIFYQKERLTVCHNKL